MIWEGAEVGLAGPVRFLPGTEDCYFCPPSSQTEKGKRRGDIWEIGRCSLADSLHREAGQAHSLSDTSLGKPKQGQGCLARPEFWQCAAWTTEMFHRSSDRLGSTSFNSVTLIRWFKLMMVLFIISCDPASPLWTPRRFGVIVAPRWGGPLACSRIPSIC